MKRRVIAGLSGSVCALALFTPIVIAGIKESSLCRIVENANEPLANALELRTGLNYSTGFEPGEGYPLGYISNTPGTYPAGCGGAAFPCWGHTTQANASLSTPTISNANPSMGAQHLRLTHDPATRTNQPNFGLGVDARFPRGADVSARPSAANTVSVEIAISSPGGMNYRIQPQSISVGCLATSALFMYDGSIHILDDQCGSTALQFIDTGAFWDTTGAYQNYTVGMNACTDSIYYSYGGEPLYASCGIAGNKLEQLLIFGDNYPGSTMDVDNVILSSLEGCPNALDDYRTVCGNGIVEPPSEQCDSYFGADANCPGRCDGNCQCIPICTQANPCAVVNGTNGPFITSGGFYVYSGASPFISIDDCGSTGVHSICGTGHSNDTFIKVTTVADPGTSLAQNDNCNGGQFGAGADTSASCYDGTSPYDEAYPSCLCLANPGSPILIEADDFGRAAALGSHTIINIRKKSVCEGASVGACCDTNGADRGCTDNVTQADCTGADKVWTDQGICDSVQCVCIPDCAGATCGDNGCGSSCGTCGDNNACNGVETCENRNCVAGTPLVCNDGNACNGAESCNPSSGCVPGTPLNCNDGLACTGQETCNPSSGCVAGTPINCDDGQECSVDTCNEPDGACSHDDSGCSIPTVTEWGLVVLTMLLLVGAKVKFGHLRRLHE